MHAKRLLVFIALSAALVWTVSLINQPAQAAPHLAPEAVLGTAFTYQGQLKSGGTAVNGSCEMAFRLYDAASAGSLIGSPLTQTVTVNAGLFTTQLDFGASAFNGQARWLETAVKCGSDTVFTTLSRQALTAVPYALALPGLRTEANANGLNVIGGHVSNTVTAGTYGATIGGGGGSGDGNRHLVSGNYSTIGGGRHNQATASFSVIGGGLHNNNDGLISVISGGTENVVSSTAMYGVIGGGLGNVVSGSGATVGGGGFDSYSSPMGNQALASAATIGGGFGNIISPTAYRATIGGGFLNVAGGQSAVVPGGMFNSANGDNSLAAGYHAAAAHGGTFVWADASSSTDFTSSANNQFLIRAGGGVGVNTTSTLASGLTVNGRVIAGGPATGVAGGEPLVARGANAGVSLEDRGDSAQRWVMFANNGTWRLWNGTDRVQVGSNGAVSITTNAGNAGVVAVGERYRDNAIIAWGDVAAAGNLSADFGVASVAHSTGIYTITLTASALDGFSLVPTAIAEVDSPPTSAANARLVTLNTVAANQFIVYITNGSYALVDNQFYFSVTGR